ncbi:hypothetical protein BV898_05806 [Hypsibius exemplaris]|uniref:Uncharacterized protein n=1 Tax=Hypsibius exemplaris TaxID=2072580 RepID=A0A1W0WYG3_HYPEX|nr:hypothetical protein BV898_05806 [Hypsibius exemplaris]
MAEPREAISPEQAEEQALLTQWERERKAWTDLEKQCDLAGKDYRHHTDHVTEKYMKPGKLENDLGDLLRWIEGAAELRTQLAERHAVAVFTIKHGRVCALGVAKVMVTSMDSLSTELAAEFGKESNSRLPTP